MGNCCMDMSKLFSAKKARSRRLVQKELPANELDKVLYEIERICYLRGKLYWNGYLKGETLKILSDLGYDIIINVNMFGIPTYTIQWDRQEENK